MQHYSPEFLQYKAPLVHVVLTRQCLDLLPLVCNLLTASINAHSVHRSVWDDCFIHRSDSKYIFEIVGLVVPYHDTHPESSHSHSSLSPFNSSSDLFPNGILSCRWFDKYVHLKPCVCVQLFMFNSAHNDLDSLVSEIEAFKAQCARTGASPFIILASDGDLRLALSGVPAKTNLPRLAVLHVFSDSPTLKRDCETLVNTLLGGVRQCAPPFYAQIETRIKNRSNKYYTCPLSTNIDTQIQLTPKFLECRNLLKQAVINLFAHPENATISTQLFELAYQDLLSLVSTNLSPIIDDPNVSAHDIALYHQIRTLLDVAAFHSVRGLFVLRRPLEALRVHHLHISAVEECCKPSPGLQNWKAIQFEWLGQFMSMLPHELLLPIRELLLSVPFALWSNLGELMVPNSSFIDTIPVLTGWMFVRASSLLKLIEGDNLVLTPIPQNYLFEYKDSTEILDKRIDLLKRGIAELDSDTHLPKSVIAYLSWELSKGYATISEESLLARIRSELITLYNMCSDFFLRRKATAAGHYFQRLLLGIYRKDNNTAGQLLTSIQLSMGKVWHDDSTPQCSSDDGSVFSSFCLDEISQPLLSADLAICGPSGSQTCVLGDSITIQLSISSNLSISRLLSIVAGKGPVRVVIESIEFQTHDAQHEQSIRIKHSSDFPLLSLAMAVDLKANLEIPICELGKCKIVNTTLAPRRIGRFKISLAQMNIKFAFDDFELTRVENMGFAPHFAYSSSWYSQSNGKVCAETRKLANGLARNYIDVGPVAPSITVAIDATHTSDIILGEAIRIPVLFNVSHPPHGIEYEKIAMAVRLPSNSDQLMRLHWDGLKDDEPLDLMTSSNVNESSCDLIAAVSMPPHMVQEPRNFDFELVIQYVQQGHSYHQLASEVSIPILSSPCLITATITRHRDESDGSVELKLTDIAPRVTIKHIRLSARSATAGVGVAALGDLTFHPEKNMAVSRISINNENSAQHDCRLAVTSEIIWERFGKQYTFNPADTLVVAALPNSRIIGESDQKNRSSSLLEHTTE